jgi:hypothetical protein
VTPEPVVALDRVLESARQGWDAAARAAAVVESVRLVAGAPVRFRFAGRALVDQLLAPLCHLDEVDAEPVFTMHAWDTESTGVPVPRLAQVDGTPAPARSIIDRDRAAATSYGRVMLEAVDFGADFGHGAGYFAIGTPDDLSHGERGAPFRTAFHWWLARRGLQLAHGGAVGIDGRGVLLVGAGGAGKSSTTLACVEAGMQYAGDDYCAIETTPPPVVHSLYSTAKVVDADVARYPNLARGATRHRHATDDKSLYLVARARPECVVPKLALAAIVVPVRTANATTSFARASSGHALQALAPSTLGQLPGHAARSLATLAAAARAVPAYRLELGHDRATVAPAVRALVEQLAPEVEAVGA